MPLFTSQFGVGVRPAEPGAADSHKFDTFTLAFTFADTAS
jgi:hypothetical protein